MSIKLKALLQLVGLVALGVAGAEIVNFITNNVPRDTIISAIQFGVLGLLLYVCYGLLLARLVYKKTLENLSNKLDK